MGISKITRNFQITLPRDVRELKDFQVGDRVLFVVEGERVDIEKVEKSTIADAAGLWENTKESGIEYTKRIRQGWKKSF